MEYKDLSLWQMINIIALVFINCLDNICAGDNSLLIGLTLILLGFFCYENEEIDTSLEKPLEKTLESAKQSVLELESAIEQPIESDTEQSTQSAVKSVGVEHQKHISPVNKNTGEGSSLPEPFKTIEISSDFYDDILNLQPLTETTLLSPLSDPESYIDSLFDSDYDSNEDNSPITVECSPLVDEDTSEDPVFTKQILSAETSNEEFLALLDKEFGNPTLLYTCLSTVSPISSLPFVVEPLKIMKRRYYEMDDIPLYIKKRCAMSTQFARLVVSGGFDEYLRRKYSKSSWFFNGEGNWKLVLSQQTVPGLEGLETLTKPQRKKTSKHATYQKEYQPRLNLRCPGALKTEFCPSPALIEMLRTTRRKGYKPPKSHSKTIGRTYTSKFTCLRVSKVQKSDPYLRDRSYMEKRGSDSFKLKEHDKMQGYPIPWASVCRRNKIPSSTTYISINHPNNMFDPICTRILPQYSTDEAWCDICGEWLSIKTQKYAKHMNDLHGVSPISKDLIESPIKIRGQKPSEFKGYCYHCNGWVDLQQRDQKPWENWNFHNYIRESRGTCRIKELKD